MNRIRARWWMDSAHHLWSVHRVSKKTVQNYYYHNFAKFGRIVKIFDTEIAERTGASEVYSFSTTPNLCQHTTVWNADVQNYCYITL